MPESRCQIEAGPGELACAKGTRQILWVFALMTSVGNPGFNDTSPTDSLQVAAP